MTHTTRERQRLQWKHGRPVHILKFYRFFSYRKPDRPRFSTSWSSYLERFNYQPNGKDSK